MAGGPDAPKEGQEVARDGGNTVARVGTTTTIPKAVRARNDPREIVQAVQAIILAKSRRTPRVAPVALLLPVVANRSSDSKKKSDSSVDSEKDKSKRSDTSRGRDSSDSKKNSDTSDDSEKDKSKSSDKTSDSDSNDAKKRRRRNILDLDLDLYYR